MTLTAHLASFGDAQLRTLLERRPDLARPAYGYRPISTFDELAQRAAAWSSQAVLVDSLDRFESAVLDLSLLVGSDGSADDLVRESAGLLPAADAQAGVEALAALGLLWIDGAGRWHAAGQLRSQMLYPFGLGRPFARVGDRRSKDELVAIAQALGVSEVRSTSNDGRRGRGGPVKADYAAAIAGVLADRGAVEQILQGCPHVELAATYAEELAPSVPLIDVSDDLDPFVNHLRGRRPRSPTPTDWFLDRGLLVALPDRALAEIPREVGLAWRGGRPTEVITRHAPPVVGVAAGMPGAVDGAASAAALDLISGVTAIINEVRDRPLKANKSGGVGVRAVATFAKKVGRDPRRVAQLLELGHVAGLVTMGRDQHGVFVVAGEGAEEWTAGSPAEQWLALVHAWWQSRRMVAHAGGRGVDGKPINPIGARPRSFTGLDRARQQLLQAVAAIDPGQAAEPGSVVSHLEFASEAIWAVDDPDITGGGTIYQALRSEAELLGAIAAGGLPTPLRRVVEGDWEAARSAAADLLPEVTDELLVQPDLTIVAPGPVSADLSRLLDLVATIESRGGATTWRLGPDTVRDAFDAGYTTAMLLDVLERHALNGLPQPVRYLFDDVARRYGSVRVRAAASILRSDDEALLATVVAHRRLAPELTLVAPTVAVSSLGETALLDELRTAGFLPVLEADDGTLVLDAGVERHVADLGSGGPGRPPTGADDPDVPWWRRPPPEQRWAGPPIDLDGVIERLRAATIDAPAALPLSPEWAFEEAWSEPQMNSAQILGVLLRARQCGGAVLVSTRGGDDVVGLVSTISPEDVVIDCLDCGLDHSFTVVEIAAVEDADDCDLGGTDR